MDEKRDWVKTIAIILAVVFFIFWIVGTSSNTNDNEMLSQRYQDLYDTCNATLQNDAVIMNTTTQTLTMMCQTQLQNLHNQWQISFDSLMNCYEQGTAQCKYTTPTLNLTK